MKKNESGLSAERFIGFCRQESLIENGDIIIAAYSGGIDSAVLLNLLLQASGEFSLTVIPAYFNHGLRGKESEDEELFIRSSTETMGLVAVIGNGDIKKLASDLKISTQESARKLRYKFLQSTAETYPAAKIAAAHHRTDQAETVLMRFLQGTSVKGLRGIPVIRGNIIRPLMFAAREEIEEYAVRNSVQHFEDSSNSKSGYVRNRIRHDIMPVLKEKLGTGVENVMLRHGERFQQVYEMLDELTESAKKESVLSSTKEEIILDIELFRNYFTVLKQNLLFECFDLMGTFGRDLYYSLAERIADFCSETNTRRSLYITEDVLVEKTGRELVICRHVQSEFRLLINPGAVSTFFEYPAGRKMELVIEPVKLPPLFEIRKGDNSTTGEQHIELIDRSAISGNLTLRTWEPGDVFIPLGMDKAKKLGDFFTDLKTPLDKRGKTLVLADREKILWVCGFRIDDRVKITGQTEMALNLKMKVRNAI